MACADPPKTPLQGGSAHAKRGRRTPSVSSSELKKKTKWVGGALDRVVTPRTGLGPPRANPGLLSAACADFVGRAAFRFCQWHTA